MKNTIKLFGLIAIVAVIAFTMVACASLFAPFGEVINSAEALKEYLESQPANSPDAPIKITLKIEASMLNGIADILRSTDKYVSLQLRGITTIPDSAFRDCKSLTNMDLYTATRIGNDAFRGCTNLTSLSLSYELSEFSQTAHTALADCPSLTTINAYNRYSSYQGVLYDKDRSRLIFCPQGKTGAFTVPDSVWEIVSYAFYGSKITSITISGGWYLDLQRGGIVTVGIRDNAFINCSNLTSVTIKGDVIFGNNNVFDGNLKDAYYATGKAIIGRDGRQMGIEQDTCGGTFTRVIGSNTWTILSFPSGFMGTWRRDNFGNTLTFSTNSFTDSAQRGERCILMRISDNSYTCYWKGDDEEFTLTFRFVSGNLVVEGDSGTGQLNWNGTWKKQ